MAAFIWGRNASRRESKPEAGTAVVNSAPLATPLPLPPPPPPPLLPLGKPGDPDDDNNDAGAA